MTPTHTKETWSDRFDDQFVWEVRPVGVVEGTEDGDDHREYMLGAPFSDFSDDATLGKIKAFISQELSRLEEEKDRNWTEKIQRAKETAVKAMGKNPISDLGLELLSDTLDALITKKENSK